MLNKTVLSTGLPNPEPLNPELLNPELLNPELLNPELLNPELLAVIGHPPRFSFVRTNVTTGM
ncbi:hypothetical protein ACWEOE_09170 [Amycolatopsis sp. NPDC004368]